MTFEDFQHLARLYVIGALYPGELARFESARAHFGARAQAFLRECQALRDAFALSLRPASSRQALQARLAQLRPTETR